VFEIEMVVAIVRVGRASGESSASLVLVEEKPVYKVAKWK